MLVVTALVIEQSSRLYCSSISQQHIDQWIIAVVAFVLILNVSEWFVHQITFMVNIINIIKLMSFSKIKLGIKLSTGTVFHS